LDDGTSLRIPYLTIVTGTVGATTFSGSGANLTSIPNAALTNSTISGISLGSNLATLTIGTGLSGTSYNGSTGVTIANTITNNNQLTNGAGYITSAALSSYLPLSGGNITGNLTVGGPASALAQLHIYNASAAASFLLQTNSSTNYAEIAARNYNQTSTAYYRQYSSSASGTDFGVSRNNLAALFSNYASNFAIGTQNGGDLILGTANTERMKISSGGAIYFGLSGDVLFSKPDGTNYSNLLYSGANANVLFSGGSGGFGINNKANSIRIVQISDGGNLTATGDITAYSDARVKENIVKIDSALDKINGINGYYYNRIDGDDRSRKIGFIAQEMQMIVPELVNYDSAQDKYSVLYGNTTALLVEAIKEQQTQIEELKIIINGLTK
jgi:hypothetical protein